MTPAHDHDCLRCKFVGIDTHTPGEPKCNQVDLYICLRPDGDHALIRRYSSEGSAYGCVAAITWNPLPARYQLILDKWSNTHG